MSCAGRGICGCGRKRCAVNAWWFAFCGQWWLIAFEMSERTGNPRKDAFDSQWGTITDNEIDSWRESEAV